MEQNNQNVQIEESISLMDIIKLLLGKIKVLILVVLIGAIVGSAFAVWQTYDVNCFGTRVEFYVNPEKPEESTGTSSGTAAGGSQYGVYGAYGRHVMDNMIKLLSSDSFAERLLLNGEDLPDTTEKWFLDTEVDKNGVSKNEALQQAIDEAKPYLDKVALAEENYNTALSIKAEAVKEYSVAQSALSSEWKKLFQEGLVDRASFNENDYFDLEVRPEPLKNAYDAYVDAQNDVTLKTTNAINAEEAWKTAKRAASVGDDSPVEKALNIWRQSSTYASQLAFYEDSISYSYLEDEADFEDANNLARSFIYVNISIQHSSFGQGYAIGSMLLERVKKVVPAYVAENMTIPDGYSGTNCQRITRTDNIRLTNPLYTTKQAIKYGILMAAVAFVFAAVIIILLDKSDKRLRDTEIITKKFNVPLLGIVPTIEELKAEQAAKRKTDKKTEVK